jgi:hypothetical protein
MRPTFLFSSSIATLFLVGCSGGERVPLVPSATYPTAPTQSSASVTSSVPDVSGAWTTTGAAHLTVPSSVVNRLFGIEPEGPITHLRCEGSSSMQLVQSGTTFSGVATRTAITCETGNGHIFVPPPTAFAPTTEIADGVITGRGLHFLIGSVAGLGCPHNGAITGVDSGTATEIRASGRCIIPGHPKSPAPLDPPPLGTSHDTSFVATRP